MNRADGEMSDGRAGGLVPRQRRQLHPGGEGDEDPRHARPARCCARQDAPRCRRRKAPRARALRSSGVKCLPSETLHDVRSAIARGSVDVDSLAAWRIAELRRDGVEATARIVWRDKMLIRFNAEVAMARTCALVVESFEYWLSRGLKLPLARAEEVLKLLQPTGTTGSQESHDKFRALFVATLRKQGSST